MSKNTNLIKELSWRGLVKDIANEELLGNIIDSNSSFYIGFDPTADSLHLGHYSSFNVARIVTEQTGMKPIFVIGGFTGAIGDPSGKSDERKIMSKEVLEENIASIMNQIKSLASMVGITDFEIVNNNDFYNNMTIIELFQNYGKLFNVNKMLSKDMVKSRLDSGISLTEFSYQMFQSIDFLKLFENFNTKLQIGGSDQWGNIISGIELIRKVKGSDEEVSGITTNLITDSNGNKIGKTSDFVIWLDKSKTSSYNLFQYLINLDDETAKDLLPKLTSITEEEFAAVTKAFDTNPKAKPFQHELAKLILNVIHSSSAYDDANTASQALFNDEYNLLSVDQLKSVFKQTPSIKLTSDSLIDSVIESNSINSKREYREFLENGAIKINGQTITDEDYKVTSEDYILDTAIVLQLGKKKKIVIWK